MLVRKIMIRAVMALLLVGLPGVVHAASLHTSLTDPAQQERFHKVCQRLVCQCGCNLVLDVCNHHNCGSATPMRARVDKEILAGRTNDEIVAGFVDDMGLVVLSAPPTSGFDLTAWVLPVVLLLVAGVVITLLLKRWRSLAPATPVGGAAVPPPSSGAHSDQIEQELRDL